MLKKVIVQKSEPIIKSSKKAAQKVMQQINEDYVRSPNVDKFVPSVATKSYKKTVSELKKFVEFHDFWRKNEVLKSANEDTADAILEIAKISDYNNIPKPYADILWDVAPKITAGNKEAAVKLASVRDSYLNEYVYNLKDLLPKITKENKSVIMKLADIKMKDGDIVYARALPELLPKINKENAQTIIKLGTIKNQSGFPFYAYELNGIAPMINAQNKNYVLRLAKIKGEDGLWVKNNDLKSLISAMNSKNKENIVKMAELKNSDGQFVHKMWVIPECIALVDDIGYKLINVSDKKVVDFVDEKNILNLGRKQLHERNDALDVYHTFNSDYSHIGTRREMSTTREFYKFAKENPNVINFEPRALFDANHWSDESIDFIRDTRFERLKSFCKSYPDTPMSDYFYNEYYLKSEKIPKNLKLLCTEIDEKFGTKVFLSGCVQIFDEDALKYVEKELSEWNRASCGEAKMPPVVDFSLIKKEYIDNKSACGQSRSAAFFENFSDAISVGGYNFCSVFQSFRHEMTHANDLGECFRFSSKYDVDVILPKRRDNSSQWVPDMEISPYKQEFLNAGLSESHTKYGHNNVKEFIAVASEGDMSKYSPKFKEMLIDFGMPEWMFNMKTRDEISEEVLK